MIHISRYLLARTDLGMNSEVLARARRYNGKLKDILSKSETRTTLLLILGWPRANIDHLGRTGWCLARRRRSWGVHQAVEVVQLLILQFRVDSPVFG